MWISGIEIEVTGKVDICHVENPSIFAPSDKWLEHMRSNLVAGEPLFIRVVSTSYPDKVAIIIDAGDPTIKPTALQELEAGELFGFFADRKVLTHLQAALDVALAAMV